MGRLIVYIVWLIVSLVLSIGTPRSRRSFYRQSRYYDSNYYGENHTFDFVRMFIRRRRALSKAKKFVKRKRDNITLKNSNVMLVYDTKFQTFALIDIKNVKRSATVNWAEQHIQAREIFNYSSEVDTEMEKTFDSICRSFNDISNYLGILQVLKQKFDVVRENNPKEEPQKINTQYEPENKIQKEKINVNTLDETALSKLPGISIILAKKIIERITFKGDFSSLEEFYDEMKIKPHFQKQLNDLIYAKPVEHKKNNNNNDRIIDL